MSLPSFFKRLFGQRSEKKASSAFILRLRSSSDLPERDRWRYVWKDEEDEEGHHLLRRLGENGKKPTDAEFGDGVWRIRDFLPLKLSRTVDLDVGRGEARKRLTVSATFRCRLDLDTRDSAPEDFLSWLRGTRVEGKPLSEKDEIGEEEIVSLLTNDSLLDGFLVGRIGTVEKPILLEDCGADAVDWNANEDWTDIPLPWTWLSLKPDKDPSSGNLTNPSLQAGPVSDAPRPLSVQVPEMPSVMPEQPPVLQPVVTETASQPAPPHPVLPPRPVLTPMPKKIPFLDELRGECEPGIPLGQIDKAIAAARKAGWVPDMELSSALADLRDPHYNVFLVGKFQVGKTRLADEAFLDGRGLLSLGEGIPTTSVVTALQFGEAPELRVVYRDGRADRVVADPTSEDIARATTAETEEARSAMAADVDFVRISSPESVLKRYTVMDTPGIDDANSAVLEGSTFRLLPQADAVVLVVSCHQLDEVELAFVKDTLFDVAHPRLMVAVSWNPSVQPMSEKMRESVLEHIRVQLRHIGRSHVPVVLFCHDGTSNGALCLPEWIRAAIDAFAERNAGPGRRARVAQRLVKSLEAFAASQRAQASAGDLADAEIAELESKYENAAVLLEERRNLAVLRAEDGIRKLAADFRSRLSRRLTAVKQDFMKRAGAYAAQPDGDGLSAFLSRERAGLEVLVQATCASEGDLCQKAFEDILVRADGDLRSTAADILSEFGVPESDLPTLVDVVDGCIPTFAEERLSIVLEPIQKVAGALLRFFSHFAPGLQRFLPGRILLDMQLTGLSEVIDERFSEAVANACCALEKSLGAVPKEVDSQFTQLRVKAVDSVAEAVRIAKEHKPSLEETQRLLSSAEAVENESRALFKLLRQ